MEKETGTTPAPQSGIVDGERTRRRRRGRDIQRERRRRMDVLTEGSAADHHAVHQGDDHAELAHGSVETHAEQPRLQGVDEDQGDVLLQQP